MNLIKKSFLLALFLVTTISSMQAQQTGTIEVIVTGLKNTDGQIMISINNGPDGWPESNFLEQRFIPKFTAPTFSIFFKDIPYGNYAIGILHDKDKNGEMTKNFMGIPKESYGFSRNYKVVFRAPKYEEANFDLNTPKKQIPINLQD